MDESVLQAQRVLQRAGIDPIRLFLIAPNEIQLALGDIWMHLDIRRGRKWKPRDGKMIKFCDLEDQHLLNILGCYDRGKDAEGRQFSHKGHIYRSLTFEAYYRGLTYIGYHGKNPIIDPWELVKEYAM